VRELRTRRVAPASAALDGGSTEPRARAVVAHAVARAAAGAIAMRRSCRSTASSIERCAAWRLHSPTAIDKLAIAVDATARPTRESRSRAHGARSVHFGSPTKESPMHAFEAIDLFELVTVTGGEDPAPGGTDIFGPGAGANRTDARGDLKVKTPVGLEISGNGSYSTARDAYGTCMDKLPSNPTNEQLEICGKLLGR